MLANNKRSSRNRQTSLLRTAYRSRQRSVRFILKNPNRCIDTLFSGLLSCAMQFNATIRVHVVVAKSASSAAPWQPRHWTPEQSSTKQTPRARQANRAPYCPATRDGANAASRCMIAMRGDVSYGRCVRACVHACFQKIVRRVTPRMHVSLVLNFSFILD